MAKPLHSYVVCKIVTLRKMGLSYKEIKEKLGLKSRSTAQTAYQRFLRTNSCGEKTNFQAGQKSSAEKSKE